jgi:hypothetical protein
MTSTVTSRSRMLIAVRTAAGFVGIARGEDQPARQTGVDIMARGNPALVGSRVQADAETGVDVACSACCHKCHMATAERSHQDSATAKAKHAASRIRDPLVTGAIILDEFDRDCDGKLDLAEMAALRTALHDNKGRPQQVGTDEYGRKVGDAYLDSSSPEPSQPTAQGKDSPWHHSGRHVKQERADK